MKVKQAQVTIYIIIGIVILIVIASGTYLVGQIKTTPTTTDSAILKTYTENCLKQTGKEAIIKLGEHGGYINPADKELSEKNFKLDTSNGEEDGLLITPQNPVIYWWQLKSPNNCKECQLTNKNTPTLQQQTKQIETYVNKEITNCLNNFEPFLKQAYTVTAGNKTTTAILTENNIRIKLEMQTTLSKANMQTKQNIYETTIEIPLKKIYETAQTIITEQAKTQQLEEMLMHQIALYSDTDAAKLPPITAITHTPEITTWNKQQTENNIKQTLTLMTALIQANNTKEKRNLNKKSEYEKGALQALTFNAKNISAPELEINFNYFDWPIYFNINPAQNNKIMPDIDRTAFPQNILPPFQTNYYEFFYDITAPVLVRITAPKALNGEGYTYSIAAEINIRRNKNLLEYNKGEGTIAPWTANMQETTATTTEYNYQKCEQPEENKYVCTIDNTEYSQMQACAEKCYTQKTITGPARINKTFFCDENQKTSGTARMSITDALTQQPIKDATAIYTCGNQITCNIGITNAQGIIRQKLPICYNGLLKINAEGYEQKNVPLTTETSKRTEVKTSLNPTKTVNTAFKKANIKKTNAGTECCDIDTIGPFEKITLTIEKIKENKWDEPYTRITQYTPNNQRPTIELAQGKYKITAMLTDELGFAIPQNCAKIETKHYPETSQIFKPAMLGGLEYEWEITNKQLQTAKTIQFTILKVPTPNCVTETNCIIPNCIGLDQITKINEYAQQYQDKLAPLIVNS